MTFAGSFVHGSGEEQDIEEFLSQIDDMTSAAAGGSGEVNLRGGSTSGGADLFLGSSSPPTQQQVMVGDTDELVFRPDEGRAIADAFPSDWLSDLELLGLETSHSSATPPEQPTPAPALALADSTQQQEEKQHRVVAEYGTENEEILGTEPEILDEETAYDSGAAAAGMLMSAGGRMASWATGTPASFVGAAAAALRGDTRRTASGSTVDDGGGGGSGSGSAEPSSATTTTPPAAGEPPLDWPVTLDMLGMAEAEAQPERTTATAAAPVSDLPNMPPPAGREDPFPDFVEISDPLSVSQFPKPGNALSGGSSSGGGDEHAGEGERDSSRTGAMGQEREQGQRQVLRAPLRTVEVYLRPDVTWESVSDAYMAVMLSRGLVVRQQTEKTVRLSPFVCTSVSACFP